MKKYYNMPVDTKLVITIFAAIQMFVALFM